MLSKVERLAGPSHQARARHSYNRTPTTVYPRCNQIGCRTDSRLRPLGFSITLSPLAPYEGSEGTRITPGLDLENPCSHPRDTQGQGWLSFCLRSREAERIYRCSDMMFGVCIKIIPCVCARGEGWGHMWMSMKLAGKCADHG